MDLIQEFSFYLHFEIAPCLFERIARFAIGAKILLRCSRSNCKSGKSTAGVQSDLARLLRHTHISTPVADGLMNLQ